MKDNFQEEYYIINDTYKQAFWDTTYRLCLADTCPVCCFPKLLSPSSTGLSSPRYTWCTSSSRPSWLIWDACCESTLVWNANLWTHSTKYLHLPLANCSDPHSIKRFHRVGPFRLTYAPNSEWNSDPVDLTYIPNKEWNRLKPAQLLTTTNFQIKCLSTEAEQVNLRPFRRRSQFIYKKANLKVAAYSYRFSALLTFNSATLPLIRCYSFIITVVYLVEITRRIAK